MRTALTVLAITLVLSACSKVTQENYAKVREGMSEKQVHEILGSPTESRTVSVLGISGTHSKWVSGDTAISIRFVNGEVATASFDKPTTAKK